MQELNDGILKIYKKLPAQNASGTPIVKLKLHKRAWFGYIGFSVSEHYSALQSNAKVEKRVQILQDKAISNLHVVQIEEQFYQVGRVDHGKNRNKIPITYLTLERTTKKYDVK